MMQILMLVLLSSYRYIACYKPALTLCSLNLDSDRALRKGRDPRSTLADLSLPNDDNNNNNNNKGEGGLHIVGRLDRDSEGLLLLTDDGQFTARVLSYEHCHKRYWALVQGIPSEEALEAMRAGGLEIRGAITRPPIGLRVLSQTEVQDRALPKPALGMDRVGTWLDIVLNEGRNRQVRKITAAAGHKTIRLCRVGIGSFEWESRDLQPGEWKDIRRDQVLGL
jgi:23S rRNA pseudouridine2457 synthase